MSMRKFEAWWARNHPFDWWAKERNGEPLPDADRLRVWAVADAAYKAGMERAAVKCDEVQEFCAGADHCARIIRKEIADE